jgi:5-methyltetrahydrofolate--homocysteine methyltransferase
MIIVAEKINTSRKSVADAVEKRDAQFIIRLAGDQAEAGADYIDVNAGTFLDQETECLCWLVETVQGAVSLPLCLDSPNPKALLQAMKLHKGVPMINSISLDADRFTSLLPVVTSGECQVVGLCMADTGMPRTAEERVLAGSELVSKLVREGIPLERILLDPLVQPISVDGSVGSAALEAIGGMMTRFPGVKTICGLSNVSFGLPHRGLINRSFLALCMCHGLSAAILDPTDSQLMATLLSVEMLLGRDEYCEKFINAYQRGRIG